MADVIKLQYLENCMQGEAKKVFATLVKRNVNYNLAKEHLSREYGDSERNQKRLVKELRFLKAKSDSMPDQLNEWPSRQKDRRRRRDTLIRNEIKAREQKLL